MASTKPSKFKPCLILLLISCTPLLNIIQTSHAVPDGDYSNVLNTTSNKNETGFNWYDQKTWLPAHPVKCVESFREAGVCLTDFLTNFGRPSAACCKALNNIDSSCLPALMPLLNPYIGHILGELCSFLSSGGGVFPFPFTPSVPSGDAGATSPPPSVPSGSVGSTPPPPSTPSGSAGATPPPASPPPDKDDDDGDGAGATSPPPSVPGGSVGVSPPPPSTPSGSADATPPPSPASDEDKDDDDEEC